MNLDSFCGAHIAELKHEGRYRVFAELERKAGAFPRALLHRGGSVREVTVWCSTDYLGMGQHPAVLETMCDTLKASGAGAGGTRNIAGTNHHHVLLERELAQLHGTEAALLFGSGWIANFTALATLGALIPGLTVVHDVQAHNSLREGITHGRVKAMPFRHNDAGDLDRVLAVAGNGPKLVVLETIHSMDGDMAPVGPLLDVAERHGAMTYLDEAHAVGAWGRHGAGIAERDGQAGRATLVQGTLAKGFGVAGGYVAGSAAACDLIRSFGAGFIFSTALPPAVAAGALASVRHLKDDDARRRRLQARVADIKERLANAEIAVMAANSHIVPVRVGDARACQRASELLLNRHAIYVQPINYPTVPRGSERLRLTPTPCHDDADAERLIRALRATWDELGIGRPDPPPESRD